MKKENTVQLIEDNKILDRIKNDDKRVITEVFKKYHDYFINYWHKVYPWIDRDEIKIIYHDCIIVLQSNAKNGYLGVFTCTLRSYLFTVGHNKIVDWIKKNRSEYIKNIIEFIPSDDLPTDLTDDPDPRKKRLKLIDETIDQLAIICKTLLILFWDIRLSDNDLVDMIGKNTAEKKKIEDETNLDFKSLSNYTSSYSIKVQRSRCMKILKENVLSRAVSENII
jgi:hypothetical protein